MDERPEEPDEPDEPERRERLEDFYGRDDLFGFKPATPVPRPPPRKARTATGALLTGIALGLRDVFDPEKKTDTIAIEQEASEPEGPQEYEIRLNGSPRDAQAIYRPWLGEDDDTGG